MNKEKEFAWTLTVVFLLMVAFDWNLFRCLAFTLAVLLVWSRLA